jgi:hypothetical protein
MDHLRPDRGIYLREILNQASRILSGLCRVPSMKNYGCFDRQYWSYGTCDTPCARKQEAVLALALLYKIEDDANYFCGKEILVDWIRAALRFWGDIQLRNGAFNDLYPNEYSFVATAFSAYAVSETLLLMEDEISDKGKLLDKLTKAGNWLMDKHQERVLNQESGSAIALHNIYLLTDEKKYKEAAEDKVRYIISRQSREGWLNEYGGADIGYLSVAIDYLGKYFKKTKDEDVLKALGRAADFILYFLHPDLTAGGEYGSRNTEYLIPHGFEILAKENDTAKLISRHIRNGLSENAVVAPFALDDKYLLFYCYVYLQAYEDAVDSIDVHLSPPYLVSFSKQYEEAGIVVQSSENFYLIANSRKGGALKLIFKQNNLVLDDSGILVEDMKGKRLTSFWLSDDNKFQIDDSGITISGNLWTVFDNILTPFRNAVWRIIQITLGRSSYFNTRFKEFLRDRIIADSRKSKSSFSRKITIERDRIVLEDTIECPEIPERIITGSRLSFVYGESARYFQNAELAGKSIYYEGNDIDKLFIGNKIVIKRSYSRSGELVG